MKLIDFITRIHTWTWARRPDVPIREPSVEEMKDTIIKYYNRYYDVYQRGLMPEGKVRTEDAMENFKNRMELVKKD